MKSNTKKLLIFNFQLLTFCLLVSCGSATPIEKYKKRSEQSYLMDLQEEKNQQILQNENM